MGLYNYMGYSQQLFVCVCVCVGGCVGRGGEGGVGGEGES